MKMYIPSPPDSGSDSYSAEKNYDLNDYPKGSTQDIRDNIGDHQHMKSFVTLSDDEDEKEKKENSYVQVSSMCLC